MCAVCKNIQGTAQNTTCEGKASLAKWACTPLPKIIPHAAHLDEWLRRGYNAGMGWMARHAEVRKRPANFNGKSYNTAWLGLWKYPKPLQKKHEPTAAFAQGEDYHKTIGNILKEWAKEVQGQYFVDSLPIPEKELAVLAGLGFVGKNTLLINPELGSGVFIGGILLNADSNALVESEELRVESEANLVAKGQNSSLLSAEFANNSQLSILNSQLKNKCAECRKCLDACPNKALTEDGFLDARRCASYLTIEHKGELSEEQKEWAKHSTYGCDICQRVCPYNAAHLAT